MADTHEWIEELLAGYVLRSLSGEDAVVADRLLSEHVPSCPRCRDTLAAFQGVAGEVALAPTPVPPPQLVRPRMHELLGEPSGRKRRRPMPLWAAAASVVALVGLAGWNVSLGFRANHAEDQKSTLLSALDAASRPDSEQVLLDPAGSSPQGPMTEIRAPGVEPIYLVGRDIPEPGAGHVYQVWLGSAGRYRPVGRFFPDENVTVLELHHVNPSVYDEILITEELAGATPTRPSPATRWQASLTAG
ncbi:MAG: anti-sigma factor domain-containing protein [Actinomycetota bacterium]